MSRRALACALGLWLSAGCGNGDPAPVPQPADAPRLTPIEVPPPGVPGRPWNVILISIDTLRADHLSSYGYERETSPAIDSLAADGILFEHAYSHSPKTAPSHMSLFTSLHPTVHRVLNRTGGPVDSRLSEDIPTLPQILHDAGYRTAGFADAGNLNREIGFGRGFERYEHVPRDAAATFDAGIAQLHAWNDGDPRPFLLFLHTVQVHDPYLPPAAYRARYADPAYAGPIVSDRETLERRAAESRRGLSQEFWRDVDAEDPLELQHLRDLYDACIRYTDDRIGRLLETVSELGRDRDTLIVLAADHGEEFMEHGGTRHNSLFEELLHVPLILRAPEAAELPRGVRISATTRLVDVMPTVIELLGLPRPRHLEGRSLMRLIRGQPEKTRAVFAHWRELGVRSLRAGPWKLIRIPDALHVFHLESDPGEHRPVETERPDVTAALARSLAGQMERARAAAETVEPGSPDPLDPETHEALRALGYVE